LRGRTMALFTIALHGMVSLGQLMLGSLSDLLGAPYTAGLSGAFLLVLAILITTMLYSIGRLEDH
ncbi:MAG: hypothetical protein PVG89_12665, partial [Gammaproteobacteria bacterium]|jgi:hypothetical protein